MYELRQSLTGKNILVYVESKDYTGPRGFWAEIGHKNDLNIERLVKENQKLGLHVEIDEKGFYRALVCKD